MRIPSSEVFKENPNGSLTVKRPIKIGGVQLNKVTFAGGVKIAGISLIELKGKDLQVDEIDGVFVIKGYYK